MLECPQAFVLYLKTSTYILHTQKKIILHSQIFWSSPSEPNSIDMRHINMWMLKQHELKIRYCRYGRNIMRKKLVNMDTYVDVYITKILFTSHHDVV